MSQDSANATPEPESSLYETCEIMKPIRNSEFESNSMVTIMNLMVKVESFEAVAKFVLISEFDLVVVIVNSHHLEMNNASDYPRVDTQCIVNFAVNSDQV